MREAVERGDVVRCNKGACDGLVKPDIVFFGESVSASPILPSRRQRASR